MFPPRRVDRSSARLVCKSIDPRENDRRDPARTWMDNSSSRAYGESVGERWRTVRRPPTSRDRILYLASRRCPISPDCTLRLGLLTTDLLRARRVPCPRGTCQRFRLLRSLYRLAPWGLCGARLRSFPEFCGLPGWTQWRLQGGGF